MSGYKSFMDMEVWKLSMELSLGISQLIKDLPRYEDYALNAQIRRSANSVSSNIAEGFGRSTSPDKRYFYIMARGSAYETQNHIIYGSRLGYFTQQESEIILIKYHDLIHQLNKLIKSLSA